MARAPEGVENLALHPQQPGPDRGGRRSRQKSEASRWTSSCSTGVCGRYSATIAASNVRYSSGFSSGSKPVSAVNPWRRALPREARFPLVLVGPVLWSALRRLDSICLGEVMLGAVQPRPGRAAHFSDFGL